MLIILKKNNKSWEVYLDAPPAHEIFIRRFSEGLVAGKGGLHRAVSVAYDLAEVLECQFKVIREG